MDIRGSEGGLAGIEAYVEGLFVEKDPALDAALADAKAAGLPEIQISPLQGRLLSLLVGISGSRRVLEIGTLGGFSGIHLSGAMPENGEMVTLELSERHAEVARRNFERAGLSERVEVRVGDARDSLRRLVVSGVEPFDFIFIDAEKEGYPEYLDLALELSRVGTVIAADNTIRGGSVIDPSDESGRTMRDFNEKLASHARLEATILPMIKGRIDGIAVARVVA